MLDNCLKICKNVQYQVFFAISARQPGGVDKTWDLVAPDVRQDTCFKPLLLLGEALRGLVALYESGLGGSPDLPGTVLLGPYPLIHRPNEPWGRRRGPA